MQYTEMREATICRTRHAGNNKRLLYWPTTCLCIPIRAQRYIKYLRYIHNDFAADTQVNNIMNNCCDFNAHKYESTKTETFKQHL